jgi:uncharacterized protein (TIGR00369 family)
VLVLPVRPEFVGDPRRPALHGGVLSALIDTAGGVAAWSALGTGGSVSTVDLRVDYLQPAGLGRPRGRSRLVAGNRDATCAAVAGQCSAEAGRSTASIDGESPSSSSRNHDLADGRTLQLVHCRPGSFI